MTNCCGRTRRWQAECSHACHLRVANAAEGIAGHRHLGLHPIHHAVDSREQRHPFGAVGTHRACPPADALKDVAVRSRLGNAKCKVFTGGIKFGDGKNRHGRGGRGRQNLQGLDDEEEPAAAFAAASSAVASSTDFVPPPPVRILLSGSLGLPLPQPTRTRTAARYRTLTRRLNRSSRNTT